MYQHPELTPPMTNVAMLLTRKQHLISRLEEDLGPREREQIERILKKLMPRWMQSIALTGCEHCGMTSMSTRSYSDLVSAAQEDAAYLESLIRQDFERCHPGETLDDLKRRAVFSKEDRGLLRDWMAVAAKRAADERSRRTQFNSAA